MENHTTSKQDLLTGLNPKQIEAVKHTEGPALVIAGPGSGKTRVLTHRVAYLIQQGLARETEILTVTFTNKAAKEMIERIHGILGSDLKFPWSGTFHSICAKILRKEGYLLGLSPSFVIYDSDDQKALLRNIFKDMDLNPTKVNPGVVLSKISGAKNELIDPIEYQKYSHGYFQQLVARIYPEYQKRLQENNALDFDDLIMKVVHVFMYNQDVLHRYQDNLKYIMVDEYQDTNKAQYTFSKLLSGKNKNIFVVGDMAQAIYSFRGADYRNILNFKIDYPNTTVYNLDQNYRSTQMIINAAKNVISKNTTPHLDLWTENDHGEKIRLYQAYNEVEEGLYITQKIKDKLLDGYKLSDFAVLYRTNAQSRNIEEMFLKEGLPYRLIGGLRFYARKEIKDLISYLRVIANPKDAIAWERVINTPPRGIGKKTQETLESHKWDIEIVEKLSKLPFKKWIADYKNFTVSEILEEVLEKTKYIEWLNDGTEESMYRIENIKELKSVASQFSDLDEFLENVALVEGGGAQNEDRKEAVTLMTIHSAKGLEFPSVFLVGMEEGLFPHSRAFLEPSELEEERRLCYVAITRAKKELYMTHTRSRLYFGQTQSNVVSRFVAEIPEECLEFFSKGLFS